MKNGQAPWRKKLKYKRGGSSSGGGGGTATLTESTNKYYDDNPKGAHEDYDNLVGKDNFFDQFEEISANEFYDAVARKTGLSKDEAKRAIDNINDFTGDLYDMYRGLDKSKGTKDPEVAAIYKYIQKAPKFQGEIYRGLNFSSQENLASFLSFVGNNKGIRLDAMSSFSSSQRTAENFASGQTGTSNNPGNYGVVLHVKANKSGVSIKKFSGLPAENEVLAPKGASYRAVSAGKPRLEGGKTYVDIYLEEIK